MRLVVDTSVLFSFFKSESTTRELISDFTLFELYAPSFCIDELAKHKELIRKTAGLSEREFEEVLNDMLLFVRLVPLKEYSKFFEEAMRLSVDPDDVDFFALALKLGCPVWSEDPHFTMQSEVKVLKTSELAKTHL